MTLKEFDQVRPFLPENTEITITQTSAPPDPGVPAMEIVQWGNHDGRFNIHCKKCGWYSEDIPRHGKTIASVYLNSPCPKCGAVYYKPNENKEEK